MYRKFSNRSGEPVKFMMHIPSGQVGVVTALTSSGPESQLTIRAVAGNLMTAPENEFRPATDEEIDKRHEVAALTRPLPIPPVVLTHVPNRQAGHRV